MSQKYDPVGTVTLLVRGSLDAGFLKIDFLLLIARTIDIFNREF